MLISPLEALAQRQFAMAFLSHQELILSEYQILRFIFEVAILLSVSAISFLFEGYAAGQGLALAVVLGLYHLIRHGWYIAISYRERDVDYVQVELLWCETRLPQQDRAFSQFKIYQERNPATVAHNETMFLTLDYVATKADIQTAFFSSPGMSRKRKNTLALGIMLCTWMVALGTLAMSLFPG